MTTRLSSLQYPMLRMFAEDPARTMSIEDAQHFDQRPFRSMLIRGWITYHRGQRVFQVTPEGEAAWREFLNRDIARKDPTLPLTAYFNPTAYRSRKAS